MKTPILKRLLPLTLAYWAVCGAAFGGDRPNILWITSEDNGPHLGCYGDSYADTPNLDALAGRGMIYRNAWSTAPVCAPARTTLISGVYPPSSGAEHMRSQTELPSYMKMYPQYLREAGYYCTNNSKEDYNLTKPGTVWDESSRDAHWNKRAKGQPFFAIFNITTTHESQIRRRPHRQIHDPAKVRLPRYHPDIPEARQDWAQYHDKMTEMDGEVGKRLRELEAAGLMEDTIIFYYGDHGPGMPRGKRWPYNSGLNVPLIVSVPEKYRDLAPSEYRVGGRSDRLVGFIDLAPTLLSLIGSKPPAHMQGHAFMGAHEADPQPFLFGFRGRMDERIDMVRVVRDERYIYIRNYMPHKIYGQHVGYMFQTPTTARWKELYDRGELSPPATYFWETKPAEELYDLRADPDEVSNLIGRVTRPDDRKALDRLRQAHQAFTLKIRDVGFLPEHEIHARSVGATPYDMGHDDFRYPLRRIMETADIASRMDPDENPALLEALNDGDSAVRYWGALGILMRGEDTVRSFRRPLRQALNDAAPAVRVAAAEGLGRYGNREDVRRSLEVLMEHADPERHGAYIAMAALNAIGELGAKAAPHLDAIRVLPDKDPNAVGRANGYVSRLIEKLVADLEAEG